MAEDSQAEAPPSFFQAAEQSTESIAKLMAVKLARWPMIHFLMDQFGGLVHGVAEKLLSRQSKTAERRERDTAIIESCPRLFNECFAAYLLARRGLILQSLVGLRTAFEVATQGILFIENEEAARRWLSGKQIRPKEVRELTSMPEHERKLYARLCDLTHPNYEASRYFSVPVPGYGTMGKASFYGSWLAPKHAGQVAIQLLWAQFVFVERFYDSYADDLSEQGLLWRGPSQPTSEELTWPQYLAVFRDILTSLTNEHEAQTPDDVLKAALALSSYTQDEKEVFRRAFEEISAERAQRDRAEPDPSSA